ncbi:hypothetical protein GCM10009733_112240 [Nonomuraea maheshkhaliensis]|uniref:Uncharacterized protein n=1 Tax=Nonomuraea maheshkhaliensis TaxID=419590 RepID=A0ABN2IBK5_9ACTN
MPNLTEVRSNKHLCTGTMGFVNSNGHICTLAVLFVPLKILTDKIAP